MRTIGLTLGHIGEIAITVDLGWLLVLSLVLSLFLPLFPGAPLWALLCTAMLYLCLLLHELAHVVVAARYGVATREILFNVFGTQAFLDAREGHPQELRIALAGPLTSIALAALCAGGLLLQILTHPISHDAAHYGLVTLVMATLFNLAIAAVNLLPLYPLDGGRILRALLLRHTHDRRQAIWLASLLTVLLGSTLIGWSLWQSLVNRHPNGLLRTALALFLISQAIRAYRAEMGAPEEATLQARRESPRDEVRAL